MVAYHTRTQGEVEWLMEKLEQRSILALELLGVPDPKAHCRACGTLLTAEENQKDNDLKWCGKCWKEFCASEGYGAQDHYKCEDCLDTGYSGGTACPECDGNGWSDCERCNGDGSLPVVCKCKQEGAG